MYEQFFVMIYMLQPRLFCILFRVLKDNTAIQTIQIAMIWIQLVMFLFNSLVEPPTMAMNNPYYLQMMFPLKNMKTKTSIQMGVSINEATNHLFSIGIFPNKNHLFWVCTPFIERNTQMISHDPWLLGTAEEHQSASTDVAATSPRHRVPWW